MAEGVRFVTIKSKEVKFGTNNFLEIARKKAITSEGENVFVSISRGYFVEEGNEKRFKRSVSMPADEKTVKTVSDALLDVLKEKEGKAKKEKKAEKKKAKKK